MKNKVRGYDSSQLFRQDTLERIRQLEREANRGVKKINRIIQEGNLPEKPIPRPFPEAEDEECEWSRCARLPWAVGWSKN